MFLTKDSKPETLPILKKSLHHANDSFCLSRTKYPSFDRITRITIVKIVFTIIFEYPIPFTPKLREKGNVEIRNVSVTTQNANFSTVNT